MDFLYLEVGQTNFPSFWHCGNSTLINTPLSLSDGSLDVYLVDTLSLPICSKCLKSEFIGNIFFGKNNIFSFMKINIKVIYNNNYYYHYPILLLLSASSASSASMHIRSKKSLINEISSKFSK